MGGCAKSAALVLISCALVAVSAQSQCAGEGPIPGYYQINVNTTVAFQGDKTVRVVTDGATGDTTVTTSTAGSTRSRYPGQAPLRRCLLVGDSADYPSVCEESLGKVSQGETRVGTLFCPGPGTSMSVASVDQRSWEVRYRLEKVDQRASVDALTTVLNADDLKHLQNAVDLASSTGDQSTGRRLGGLAAGVASRIPGARDALRSNTAREGQQSTAVVEGSQRWIRVSETCPD